MILQQHHLIYEVCRSIQLNVYLNYIRRIGFLTDLKIIFQTVEKAFVKKEGITADEMATAEDFGDYLLRKGKINQKEYDIGQLKAKNIFQDDK